MKLIDEDTEKELREEVPEVVLAIETAKKDNVEYLIFMLDAFAGEPELLYKVLWFAYSMGVSVLTIPPQEKA
jgi:hypothetical protein